MNSLALLTKPAFSNLSATSFDDSPSSTVIDTGFEDCVVAASVVEACEVALALDVDAWLPDSFQLIKTRKAAL